MKNKLITGTAIGAIAGLNPFVKPMDAWRSIMGLADDLAENEAMKWGKKLEAVIAREYAEQTGAILFPHPDLGFHHERPLIHPNIPWWGGTPDRLIVNDPGLQTTDLEKAYELIQDPAFFDHVEGVWEGKAPGYRAAKYWGAEDEDIVPEYYLVQVAWYLPICRSSYGVISALIGGQRFITRLIERSPNLEKALFNIAFNFYENHVLTPQPPPVDQSSAWKTFLAKTYPRETEPMLEAKVEDDDLIQELKIASDHLGSWEAEYETLTNRFKALIGDNAGIRGDGWKVSWKKNKDSQVTDWKAAFETLTKTWDQSQVHSVIESHTTIKQGARVFRPSFPKGE